MKWARGAERWLHRIALAAILTIAAMAAPVAQELSGGLVGFSSGSDDPILIEAETLVVQDDGKVATFSGNVNVQQNETTMTTERLKVFYTGDAVNGGRPRIERIEAEGGVFVTNRDQTARGNQATFDMTHEIVTMTGQVELTQNGSVVRGEKLVVNLKTKESRIETGRKKGRVQGLFVPGSKPK